MTRKSIILVQHLFLLDSSRKRILALVGKIAQFIFHNSSVKILPENLAIVIPVDDEPGIDFTQSLPKASHAGDMMKTKMSHYVNWNAVFGYLLANSDLFFEDGVNDAEWNDF